MRIITLQDQLEWSQKCLSKMRNGNRPAEEIALQESVCYTIRMRIEALGYA